MPKQFEPLSEDQNHAIAVFSETYGANWKQELSNCWQRSGYPRVSDEVGATLQKLRNTHGPSWLFRKA